MDLTRLGACKLPYTLYQVHVMYCTVSHVIIVHSTLMNSTCSVNELYSYCNSLSVCVVCITIFALSTRIWQCSR